MTSKINRTVFLLFGVALVSCVVEQNGKIIFDSNEEAEMYADKNCNQDFNNKDAPVCDNLYVLDKKTGQLLKVTITIEETTEQNFSDGTHIGVLEPDGHIIWGRWSWLRRQLSIPLNANRKFLKRSVNILDQLNDHNQAQFLKLSSGYKRLQSDLELKTRGIPLLGAMVHGGNVIGTQIDNLNNAIVNSAHSKVRSFVDGTHTGLRRMKPFFKYPSDSKKYHAQLISPHEIQRQYSPGNESVKSN